eukprot:GHVU01198125.1.p1 GENE.GHVU01198125.1~~GHVU01198125.1.p1  ORF type:complete len:120 (-),score=3.83 GHVU01198125.1:197-556(-)
MYVCMYGQQCITVFPQLHLLLLQHHCVVLPLPPGSSRVRLPTQSRRIGLGTQPQCSLAFGFAVNAAADSTDSSSTYIIETTHHVVKHNRCIYIYIYIFMAASIHPSSSITRRSLHDDNV